jgi:hypothetical protein
MKFTEIAGGIRVFTTLEENELLGKFDKTEKVYKTQLSEREQIVARKLVEKSILRRSKDKDDGKLYFSKNSTRPIRRS